MTRKDYINNRTRQNNSRRRGADQNSKYSYKRNPNNQKQKPYKGSKCTQQTNQFNTSSSSHQVSSEPRSVIADNPPNSDCSNEKQSKSCGGCINPGFRHRRSCKNKNKSVNDKPNEQIVLTEDESKSTSMNEQHNETLSNVKPITMTEVDIIQKVKYEKFQEQTQTNKNKEKEKPHELNNSENLNSQKALSFNETMAINSQNCGNDKKIDDKKVVLKDIVKKEKIKNEKKLSDEEVVCLGKLERFENLVDDDEDEVIQKESNNKIDTLEKSCLICDKEGHNSLECQMICKNCSEPYHNLKTCPNPVNISIMLQQFFEFCMKQCCEYNPDQKFHPTSDINSKIKNSSSKTIEASHHNHHRKRKRTAHSSDSSNEKATDSDSQVKISSKKRKKKIKSSDFVPDLTQQYPNFSPFAQTMPFAAFSGHTTSTAFNPMMLSAFGPMMHNSYSPKVPPLGISR